MKKIVKNIVLFIAVSTLIVSCDKDKDKPAISPKPVISGLEVGEGASHSSNATGQAGSDLHIEAKIVAEAKIDYVEITIHPEGKHNHGRKVSSKKGEWKFTKKFTDLKGQKNGTFHKHIDIPATAKAGDYHFHFKVVDQAGGTTEKEVELKVKAATTQNQVITNFEVGHANSKTVQVGKDLHLEAKVTTENKIDYIEVVIHHKGKHTHGRIATEWKFTKEYTEFKGKKSANFHKHIDVPATAKVGDYHLHFKVVDLKGKATEKEVDLKVTATATPTQNQVITNFEVGHANSKTAQVGKDLHLEAKVTTENKIDYIEVVIHHKGKHTHGRMATEWKFTKKYTEFKGKKSANFHKHIDVPATAKAGDYHLHFKVVDLKGKATEKEVDLKITGK